ncbi:MAG: hypothetical protein ACK5O9_02955 [Holosporales bacterium]
MKAVHSFIRCTPKELLKECCEQCAPDIAATHDWKSGNSKKTAEALTEAFATSSREQYAAFKQTAERVTEMTDSLGQAALQACVRNFDTFRSLTNAYARATWAFLHEPTAFRRAEEIHYLDYRRQGRMWDGFHTQSNLKVQRDAGALAAFKKDVLAWFRAGNGIKIEIFDRIRPAIEEDDQDENLVQITVYREGLPESKPAFVADDVVAPVASRPAYEFGISYEPATGVLEVVADGRETRDHLAKVFCSTLLRDADGVATKRIEPRRYNLQKLMQSCDFPTEPKDRIESVKVTSLRLKPYDEASRLTLETSNGDSRTIHDVAEEWFERHNPLRRGFLVQQAGLTIRFQADERNRRGRVLTVKIGMPHRCNLKSRSEEERVIGERYLQRWGLVETLQ